jgi:osmotically-inducible protein OsmY
MAAVDAAGLDVAPVPQADDLVLGNMAIRHLEHVRRDFLAAVKVVVHARVARLVGHVRCERDRELARWLVMQVPGILDVTNELTTDEASERAPLDVDLQLAVNQALGRAGLPMPNIHVFTSGGTLWLWGSVETVEQQRLAPEVGLACPGIARVDSELTVNLDRGDVPLPESKLQQDG